MAAHTGAETAAGPVRLLESPVPVLTAAPPCGPHVVRLEMTPAHAGAETATGPVTVRAWVPLVAVVSPLAPEPLCGVVETLPAPQRVFCAARPAQTGAETATGPVTLFDPPPPAALAEPPAVQVVWLAATPAQTGAEMATGPVAAGVRLSPVALAPPPVVESL